MRAFNRTVSHEIKNQIGTILGFYAFSKKDLVEEKARLPSSLKIVIGIFVLAGIALILILHRATK